MEGDVTRPCRPLEFSILLCALSERAGNWRTKPTYTQGQCPSDWVEHSPVSISVAVVPGNSLMLRRDSSKTCTSVFVFNLATSLTMSHARRVRDSYDTQI